MHYSINHFLDTDSDTFWDKIFFDEAYNRELCLGHLKFSFFEILEQARDDSGAVFRRAESVPPVEVPKAVSKVFGNAVRYIEEGRFDPIQKKWVFEVIPKVGKDKIQTKGEMWVEPRGDKGIERIFSIDTTVRVFGLGKMVENLIVTQTRSFYDRVAVFTNQWIRDKGLS